MTCRFRIGLGEVTWYDEDGEVTMRIDSNNKVTTYKNKQEPVAFASHGVINWIADRQFQHEADLYTHPQPKREWVGLTEDERQDIIGRTPPRAYLNPNDWTSDMLVYIEAKLKEKNT